MRNIDSVNTFYDSRFFIILMFRDTIRDVMEPTGPFFYDNLSIVHKPAHISFCHETRCRDVSIPPLNHHCLSQ